MSVFYIFLITIPVFLIDKLPVMLCVFAVFAAVRLAARIPFKNILFLYKFALLAAFIILVQGIFGPGESMIQFFSGYVTLKPEGLLLGAVIVCRMAALLIIFPVFTERITSFKLVSDLCALGLNYRISYVIAAAFNLIPVFRNEALVIMDAQRLRGMKRHGIKAYVSLLVPLMLGAMRKAQVSSAAMDCRAFGIYKTRTWLDRPKAKGKDYYFAASCAASSCLFLFLNYTLV